MIAFAENCLNKFMKEITIPENPTIKEVIKTIAKQYGYTGILNKEMECGCLIDEFPLCDAYNVDCQLGNKWECDKCSQKDSCEMYRKGGYCVQIKRQISNN